MDLKDCPQCDTFMSETYENHPQCGDVVNHKQTIPQPPPPPPFKPPQYQHVLVIVLPTISGCQCCCAPQKRWLFYANTKCGVYCSSYYFCSANTLCRIKWSGDDYSN